MNRLPLALMWLLALLAGSLPTVRPPAAWRPHASIVPAEPVDAPLLFKPVRAERLQTGTPVRPSPWRHAAPVGDLSAAWSDAGLQANERVGRPPRSYAAPVAASRLGSPRFPTGPPSA